MGFWLIPKLVTLNDLERRNGPFSCACIFLCHLFSVISMGMDIRERARVGSTFFQESVNSRYVYIHTPLRSVGTVVMHLLLRVGLEPEICWSQVQCCTNCATHCQLYVSHIQTIAACWKFIFWLLCYYHLISCSKPLLYRPALSGQHTQVPCAVK